MGERDGRASTMDESTSTRRLRSDVRLMGDILGEVLRHQGGGRAFQVEERMRSLAKAARGGSRQAARELAEVAERLDLADAWPVLRAFTSYFELVNTAEQLHRVRVVRRRRGMAHPAPHGESVGEAVSRLAERGLSAEEAATLLETVHVQPVFTAHPTQAKRAVVLALLRRVEHLLHEREVHDLTPYEEQRLRQVLRQEVAALWESRIVPAHRPTVGEEVASGLYFLEKTLWWEVPELYRDLDEALARTYPGLAERRPRVLSFGSWIGGDRDGNPRVTAEVTRHALRRQAGTVSRLYAAACRELEEGLVVSRSRGDLPPRLRDWLAGDTRHPGEPYRELFARLAEAWQDWARRLEEELPEGLEAFGREFEALVVAAREGLGRISPALAGGAIRDLDYRVRAFGTYLASLDVRQDARWHGQVLEELLGVGHDLEAALRRPPAMPPADRLSPEACQTLETLRVMSQAQQSLGQRACHTYLISRVRSVEDVLAVLLLRKLAGGPEALDVVPLLEDIETLGRAGGILEALFQHPVYGQHLEARGRRQEVQVGYSDSNKDGGYLTSNWALYRAQQQMVRAARRAKVELTVFHGRGGTIGRGGGPANRAILALPPGAVAGSLRLTEQGEMIAERYANPAIAHRHLEQLVNAVILASVRGSQSEPEEDWLELMEELSGRAYRAYRGLVYERPDFLSYFEQATPIGEIETLMLGSRPPRRSQDDGQSIASLRAIPWVFAWVQSRHLLPAWFGLGAALQAALEGGEERRLRTMYRRWPFFATVIDNAQLAMAQADLGIARAYAGLVEDRRLAEEVFGIIEADYGAARRAILAITGQRRLLDNEPEIQRSVELRNPYVDPLSHMQVALLRRWRRQVDTAELVEGEVPPLLGAIHLSINGIAAGLRGTG